jgi:serine phosphatase RsbU (regulator of sigma subunit)
VMDGIEAARHIRANAEEMPTPLIFLTAITDQQTMIDGLDLGDDFIHKPIDPPILRAKLRAFIRLVQSQRQLREQRQRIERLNEAMQRESEIAAHILDRVLAHTEPPDEHFLQYRVVPSAVFSGDMVLARRTPAGRLHLLLADAVGHGLPAAINILPLFFPFDGMSRKGCTLATVARELNRRVRNLLPSDRFVAATLVSVDYGQRTIEIWNGGNPPALLLDAHGTIAERIDSMQMALGLNDDNPALFETQRVQCDPGDQLLLCSDGIWENPAFAGDDPAQPMAALLTATAPGQRMEALIRAAIDAGQTDDLSAVMITTNARDPGRTTVEATRPSSFGARMSLQFGPDALRRGDAVDSVLDMAASLGLVDGFPGLPAVIDELFSNALDHGVLGLAGGARRGPDDERAAFLAARQGRLDGLREGFITVGIEPDFLYGKRVLRLNVADSGLGFDWSRLESATAADPALTELGGLQRVRQLTANLAFNSQGCEAIALIPPRDGLAAAEDGA